MNAADFSSRTSVNLTSMQQSDAELVERAQPIRLLLMDCDGVLTDGRLVYSERGEELKIFHVRDGQGLVNWHRSGLVSGIITGRESKILKMRADELGIRYLKQNASNKVEVFEEIISDGGFSPEEVAFIGDDVIDLELLERVGFAAAVADAAEPLFPAVHYITRHAGGLGAVREVVDLLLAARQIA